MPATFDEVVASGKKVQLELVGLDGNAFAVMSAFTGAARQQGWSADEVDAVRDKCMEGDYDDLLCTIMSVTESPKSVDGGEVDDDLDFDADLDDEFDLEDEDFEEEDEGE